MAPVMNSSYWYFNAYTGLFFVIPWLNRLVRSCGRRELNGLMLTMFLVFSCYGTFAKMNADVFVLKSGYSFLWLALIYLVGAWMKKHQIVERYNKKQAIVLILFLTMLSMLTLYFPEPFRNILISYTSPTIVLIAVAYMVLFSKLQFNVAGQKLIQCFSPAAFGVYLIHVHPCVWVYFMKKRFTFIADSSAWVLPFKVIGYAAIVFVVCILIEKVRLILFQVLKINEAVGKLDGVFAKIGRKFLGE